MLGVHTEVYATCVRVNQRYISYTLDVPFRWSCVVDCLAPTEG